MNANGSDLVCSGKRWWRERRELRSCVLEWAGLHATPCPARRQQCIYRNRRAETRKIVTVGKYHGGSQWGESVFSAKQGSAATVESDVSRGVCRHEGENQSLESGLDLHDVQVCGVVRCPHQHSTGPFHSPLLHLIPGEQNNRPSLFPCLKSTAYILVICPLTQVFIVCTWSFISL